MNFVMAVEGVWSVFSCKSGTIYGNSPKMNQYEAMKCFCTNKLTYGENKWDKIKLNRIKC